MATGLSLDAAVLLLGALSAEYDWVQVHVGDPGTDGTANVAAETARMQVSWDLDDDYIYNDVDLVWLAVTATETWTYFTVWDAEEDGTFGFSGVVDGGAVTIGNDVTVDAEQLYYSAEYLF